MKIEVLLNHRAHLILLIMNNPQPTDLIHWEYSTIRGYDVDPSKTISIPGLIRLMHEAAVQQVLKLKLSALELEPRGLGWVLYRQNLKVFRRPPIGASVKVKTYPSGKEKAFTFRDYQVYDQSDRLIAQASSCWLLMDVEARKIAPYPEDIEMLLAPSNKLEHLPRPKSIRNEITSFDNELTQKVYFHHLDFNRHLNNTFFFTWMLDALDHSFLYSHDLKEWLVQIKGECFLGDQIQCRVISEESGVWLHAFLREGQVVAQGRSFWEPR